MDHIEGKIQEHRDRLKGMASNRLIMHALSRIIPEGRLEDEALRRELEGRAWPAGTKIPSSETSGM